MIKKYKISTTSDFGKCLKANSQINKNELIIDFKKNSYSTIRNKFTIETCSGNIIHPEGMFLNHSCDPNSAVDKNKGFLFAIKNIQINEEITFSYKDNESIITEPFNCRCNKCVRKNSIKYICS